MEEASHHPADWRPGPAPRPLLGAFGHSLDRVTWSIDCGDKSHPFSSDLLHNIRHTLDPAQQHTQAPGQPFFLTVARQGGDPDWQYPLTLQQGVPLGVTTPTLTSPNVWPVKSELAGEDREPPDLPDPTGRANYPSAKDFIAEIRKTFEEEVPMGMVSGPLTKPEAAALCKCDPSDLCPGPLAGIDEGDKIRTIYDGSIGGANTHIQNHTQERTTAPTVLDCVQALHWLLHAKDHPEEDFTPSTGASSPELGGGPNGDWIWPHRNCRWVLLKADVTKAHRRIKVLPMDWRFQVAELHGAWWVNHVGTYGMASAQLYWGRMAALLLRLLYRLFPQVDWGCLCGLRLPDASSLAAAILATWLALGTPLGWKKTHLGEINTWLGFVVHPNVPRFQIAAPKFVIITELLDQLIQGMVFTSKSVERALGRLQWATAACPLAKSLMQPFWAWKMAVTSSGHPPNTVRLLAVLLKEMLTMPYTQESPYLPQSSWWGCSDASAAERGEAYIGGWISNRKNPAKGDVYWFHYQIRTPRNELPLLNSLARSFWLYS